MDLIEHHNVIPLVDPTIARRDRMIARAVQSQTLKKPETQAAIRRIDRWLMEFAYDRLIEDYWRSKVG